MSRRGQLLIPCLLGFFLLFNVHLLPSLEQSPRGTDLLGAVLGMWLLWRFATRGVYVKPFAALFAFSTIPLLWGLYALFSDETLTLVLSVRWLLAVAWGYALFTIAQNSQQRTSLVWGLWWGCIANTIVLLLQFYGLIQLTEDVGLAAQDSVLTTLYEFNQSRAPGMHYHPNASAAVVSLIIPFSLYLYYARKAGAWVVIVGLGTLFVATQFTLTRSALLVAIVTILVAFATSRSLRSSLRLVALLALGVLPALYLLGLPGGVERWLDLGNVETNSSIRVLSNASALQISLEHPLGLGVEAGQEALLNAGFQSSHNAFLYLALTYSPFLAGALALLMLVLMLSILTARTVWSLEAILALHLFGLFLFEENLGNPSFIILASWLVAAGVVQVTTALKRRSSVRPVPLGRPSYQKAL